MAYRRRSSVTDCCFRIVPLQHQLRQWSLTKDVLRSRTGANVHTLLPSTYMNSAYRLQMFEVVFGCGHQLDIQCQSSDIKAMTAKFCILWTYSVEQSALRDSSLSLNRFEQSLKTYHFGNNEHHSWCFCDSAAVYAHDYLVSKCCFAAAYKKLLILFFSLRVKLFRLAANKRFFCLLLLSVRQDNL